MTKLSNPYSLQESKLDISVIVPCINEVQEIPALLRVLREAGSRFDGEWELLIVDGGSTDGTCAVCEAAPEIRVIKSAPSRAVQMNVGAREAQGTVFYFVHADTRPPIDCLNGVWMAYQNGSHLGGYAFEMDSQRKMLAFNSYMTKFNVMSTRGGDQTIFVCRALFEELGGFSESMKIMEEYDLLKKAKRQGVSYHLMEGQTIVSARKYEGRSWLHVQLANTVAMLLWRIGTDSEKIKGVYNRMLGN